MGRVANPEASNRRATLALWAPCLLRSAIRSVLVSPRSVTGTSPERRCVSGVSIFAHVRVPFALELTPSCNVISSNSPFSLYFLVYPQNSRGLRQGS